MEAAHDAFDPTDLLRRTAWLKALASTLVRDPNSADDLVQDTWLAFLRRPPREHRALTSWMRSVIQRVAYRRLRSEHVRERNERALARRKDAARDSLTPEQLLERFDLQRRLVELVVGLEEPFRSTVILRYFEDLAPGEIARRQDVAVTTVRWRLSKAHEVLRSRLDVDHGGSRSAWTGAFASLAGLDPRFAAGSGSAAAAASTPLSAAVHTLAIGGALMAKKLTFSIGIAVLLALAAGVGMGWMSARREAPAGTAAGSVAPELGRKLARLEAELGRFRAERDALAAENGRLQERLRELAPAAEASADSGEGASEPAPAVAGASGIRWTEFSALISKQLELLEKVQRGETLPPEEQARFDLLGAELGKISAQARAQTRAPFFDQQIFHELVLALFKDSLRLTDDQTARLHDLGTAIFADLPEDPAALSPLEQHRLREGMVGRLKTGLESFLDEDQRKDWPILDQYSKDVFSYGGKFELGTSVSVDKLVNNWLSALNDLPPGRNGLSEGQGPEAVEALKPIMEEYVQDGGALLESYAPGQNPKSLAPEQRAQLDKELLRLQERFHERVVPLLSEESRRKLYESPPLIIRFRRGEALIITDKNAARF